MVQCSVRKQNNRTSNASHQNGAPLRSFQGEPQACTLVAFLFLSTSWRIVDIASVALAIGIGLFAAYVAHVTFDEPKE